MRGRPTGLPRFCGGISMKPDSDFIGEYGGVRARKSRESDLEFILAMENDVANRDFVLQWPREKHLSLMADKTVGHLVFESIDHRPLIGYAILKGWDSTDRILHFNRLVIGEKGKGYGRDAMRLVKKIAFEQLHVHRLWLDVFADNEPAIHLYRSEGFVDEGTQRDCIVHGRRYRSQMIFSILEGEYKVV